MKATLNCAPCCWGVDDINNPNLPSWQTVLNEAAEAGFKGLELGPYGYLPLEGEDAANLLEKLDLRIVAGTIFDDLVSADNLESLLQQTDEICSYITSLPVPSNYECQNYNAPYLTVMDWGHDARDFAAGHFDSAPRLDEASWQSLIQNLKAISELAWKKYGVRAVIHPHAGGYIEFADEIARVVAEISPDLAGLCIDTGHCAYSGMDPIEVLEKYWDRVDYIHFKDIDDNVFSDVMQKRIRFFDACAEGVMCSIGTGSLNYPAIYRFLSDKGYSGHITIEQERDPKNRGTVLQDLASSKAFLTGLGF